MRKNRGNRGFNSRPLPNHKYSDTLSVHLCTTRGTAELNRHSFPKRLSRSSGEASFGSGLVVEDAADVHADAFG